MLARTGAVTRQGTIADKTTVGDASPEARDHGMSASPSTSPASTSATPSPSSTGLVRIEFQREGALALTACDAVVVCEPDVKRVPALQLILKGLEDRGIPHFLFLNKIDTFTTPVRDIIPNLQPASAKPLVLAADPDLENTEIATGFVDLASERAYVYREHAASEIIERLSGIEDREAEAAGHAGARRLRRRTP